mgnify:CR=1 FL=1
MIRVLFWILLIVNIAFFSAMQMEWSPWDSPVTAQPALNEDKMRLLSPEQIASIESKATPVMNKANASVDSTICLEWGEFLDAELKLANNALSGLGLAKNVIKRELEYEIGYWVFIPPLKDKAATSEKIAQLKDRDISEYFIVQEAEIWQNAISLGVFKTQEAAQKYLSFLKGKGVRSAQMGERGSKLKVSILRFNDADAATEVQLTELQQTFTGSELKNVQCGLTR